MTKLLEQIESRLAVCAKATPKPWLAHQLGQIGMKAKDDSLRLECGIVCHGPRDIKIFAPPKTAMSAWANNDTDFIEASRNQREGELAALRVAVEALEKPYICSVCGDRSKEKCGRVCDGDESSCCKYFLNFDQALAQITKLMGEGK